MLLFACPSPHGTNQWHLLRVEMGLKELLGARGTRFGREASSQLAISLQASAVGGRWSRGQHMG